MIENAVEVEARPAFRPLHAAVSASSRPLVRRKSNASVAESASGSSPAWKIAFDRLFAATALLFLLPVFLLIVGALLIADGRPIFFRQSRIGRNGKTFACLKFRSMVRDADVQLEKLLTSCAESRKMWAETQKLPNDPRIHWIGRILRKTSLDELPQFINVLKGDMSVVGPRPIIQAEVARYGKDIDSYTSVRPGITGLWQVSGRNETSYRERVAFDVQYASRISPLEDFRIICKTVAIVLFAKGDH